MAIALVQHVLGTSVNANTIARAYPSNNVAGNCLVCVAADGNGVGANPFSISDTQSNTWVLAQFFGSGATFNDVAIYVAANCKAGANTVTVNNTAVTHMQIAISEWSGVLTTSPIDQATGNQGSGATLTVNSITPSQNNELVIAGASAGGGDTLSAETLTRLDNNSPDGTQNCGTQYVIQTTAAATGASWTDSVGAGALAALAIASLKAAPTGAAPQAAQVAYAYSSN